MKIIYGTSNKDKVISMTKILKENNADAKLYTLADIGFNQEIVARGECKGTVAKTPGKLGGLTYVPIFIPEGFDKPLSDLDAKTYEVTHNHRDLAVKQLLREFEKRSIN